MTKQDQVFSRIKKAVKLLTEAADIEEEIEDESVARRDQGGMTYRDPLGARLRSILERLEEWEYV
jgi:hypothetical protein